MRQLEEKGDPVKKRRLMFSKNLVDTSGADFVFSDREESFKVLADALKARHEAWKQGKTDRNLHPIPFLADGPGSGKSRFLQELPSLFPSFVENNSYSQEFKDIFKSPVCINITFSNGSNYAIDEAQEISMEKSLCLRVLFQFQSEFTHFRSFYDRHKSKSFSISEILKKIGTEASCIILGIDEVNMVHDINSIEDSMVSSGQEKDTDESKKFLLSQLFKLVGGLSCDFSPFFVPVIAGTVIGPMKSVVKISRHPPLHIPLPLLSFESCLQIFEKKNMQFSSLVRTNHRLRQLISDCGGHCRSLEILYSFFLKNYHEDDSLINWTDVMQSVCKEIKERYPISNIPLGTAIAHSFLHWKVGESDLYPELKDTKYQDLEEKGLIKLVDDKVRIPYFFVNAFLSKIYLNAFSKFWSDVLLIQKDFWWQDWEIFNWNYVAFRLSLYAYLKVPTVSLKEFFSGAKMNIPDDIEIKIPTLENLKISKINYRYPSTQAPVFPIGDSVLNGSGAPFDSFVYLETTGVPLLLAFQMKFAHQDSQTPQVVSDKTVNDEFKKVNDTIATNLPGTNFVSIILGHCDGTFNENKLPAKCIVISRNEQLNFYGVSFYDRLNNRF
jgi:hypothetical protein